MKINVDIDNKTYVKLSGQQDQDNILTTVIICSFKFH